MTDAAALSESGSCSLDDPKVPRVLAHLHHESRSLSEGVRVVRERDRSGGRCRDLFPLAKRMSYVPGPEGEPR
jgi:hypothetical protein